MGYLTREPLRIELLVAEVVSEQCGGTCVFLGTVRAGSGEGNRGVTAIDYSAYEPMAEAEFARMLDEARRRWPGARIAVRHRVGEVPVGEASIGIAVATPHRAEAFEACRHVIEEVKRRLPMWKKELRGDGTAVWVDPSGKVVTA